MDKKLFLNNIKFEYVKIGEKIQNMFQSNFKSDGYTIEYKYTGYRNYSLKCDPEGEDTIFVLTDNFSGKKTTYNDITKLMSDGHYTTYDIARMNTELIQLMAIEKAFREMLKKYDDLTDVCYERQLLILKNVIFNSICEL